MPSRHQSLCFACFAAILLLTVGCANPYLDGFSGQPRAPFSQDAPVEVFGANRQDVLAMERFDAAYLDAELTYELIGSSTIVSGSKLRDAAAAEAGRELGAALVLYNFGYLTSTVETERNTYYSSDHDDHHGVDHHYRHTERSSTSSTKHWYEYRAYFFAER